MANSTKVYSDIIGIESFGEGVYAVKFALPPRYTRFLPGQFLHLSLDEFDPTTGFWPESRVFSIASEPRQGHLSIVYSVKGRYTQRMERELRVGRGVWLKLPYGDFVINDAFLARGPIALVAGGTGVSPFWPFLKGGNGAKGLVHLFYGVRKSDHILFLGDLVRLLTEPWFKLHLFVEEGEVPCLNYEVGRLSTGRIVQELGPEFLAAQYFLSGPPVMIRGFRNELISMGVEKNSVHSDEWE